ncbi:MAG: 6-bladed beta-propeller [Phycisphaerae bacterium]
MGELSAPTGVAVSPQERVFVADPPAGCVHLLDLRTRRYRALRSAGATPLVAPADVAIGDGRVFVSDAGRGVIDVFSESGDYQSTWPATLRRPAGVAWDAARQRLYVVDAAAHGCVGFSAAGVEQVRFGQRGVEPGQFNFPTFVACDARLGVIVTDSLNARVQRFSPEGQFIATFGKKGDAAGDFSLPKGVAADAAGHIYVADAHFENVQLFDDAGRLLLAFGSEGQGPGEFWLPAKLCFDGQSRLWVADSYNRRVQVFRLLDAAREPVS